GDGRRVDVVPAGPPERSGGPPERRGGRGRVRGRRGRSGVGDQLIANVATIAIRGGSSWTRAAWRKRRLGKSRMSPAQSMQRQTKSTTARPATSAPAAIWATPAAIPIARNRL